jgi:hypothetical protein
VAGFPLGFNLATSIKELVAQKGCSSMAGVPDRRSAECHQTLPDDAPKKTGANHRHERHHRHDSEKVACLTGFFNDDKHDDGMTVPKHARN